MKNSKVRIIAGPCSVDKDNISDIEDIVKIKINGKRAVAGARVVGLKSRTSFDSMGEGMGIDFDAFMENLEILTNDGSASDFVDLPSILITKELQEKHKNLIVATEIMNPSIQLPLLEKHLKGNRVMPWNPSVNQLGWPVLQMSKYCKRNNWFLGFKNAKNLGGDLIDSEQNDVKTSLEKVWSGLVDYGQIANKNKILIHRGVDVPEKGDFRNALVHNVAKRTKLATGCKLYFDPSHSYGPKLRDKIPQGIIEALRMKIDEYNYLYDGVLVETGNSKTDTDQHITIKELEDTLKEVSKFRELVV